MKKNNVLVFIFFAVIVFIVYFNSLQAEFIADDITAIKLQENTLRSFTTVLNNPLFFTRTFLFYISYKVGGLNPIVYRLWNIFFHIGVAFLIYKISSHFSKNKVLPFAVALVAAVHPVMVESVTWISGGIYAESTFFVLLSFLFYIKQSENYKLSTFIWSVVFFVLSLMSSEKVIVYPLILFLYTFLFKDISKYWKRLIPYFCLSGIWAVILLTRVSERITYLQTLYGTGNNYYFYNPLFQWSTALGSYLKLFLYPDRLTLFHSDYYLSSLDHIILWVLFILFFVGVFFSYKKSKAIFFWLLFFLISLLPTLNPFGLSSLVAERYVYLGSLGIYFIFSYLLVHFVKNKNYQIAIIVIISLLLGFRTISRNEDWKNNHNFWIATVKASPSDAKSHNSLGGVYVEEKNYKKAVEEFNKSLQLTPNFYAPYFNLGIVYEMVNDKDSALKYYLLSSERNPTYWQAYHKAAIIYFGKKDLVNAEKYFKKAIQSGPTNAVLYVNLGVIYKLEGNKQYAEQAFLKALSLEPGNQVILNEIKNLK